MLKKVHTISKNKFIRGGFIVTLSAFFANICNYLFQSLLAHSLGRANFGEIATLFSYITVSSVPLSVIATIVIQKVSASGNRIEYAKQLEEYFFRKLRKWWFLLVLPLFLISSMPRLTNLSPPSAYALIPLMLIAVLSMFHVSALQGLALFFEFAIIGLISAMIKLGGPLLVYFKMDGLFTVIVFIFLAIIFSFVANFIVFRRTASPIDKQKLKRRIETRISRFLTSRQFIITLLSLFAIVALNNIDIIFVKKLFSAADTGLYASWSLLAKIIFFVISPLAPVSFVFFSGSPSSQSKRAMNIFFLTMGCIAIVGFIGYQYLGGVFIPLFFGNQFLPVIPYLGLASLFGSFYTVIFFINNYFLARVSRLALLLPLSIPLYVGILSYFHRSIQTVFLINICFAGGLAIIYTSAYLWSVTHAD